jgi:hypothetical protein
MHRNLFFLPLLIVAIGPMAFAGDLTLTWDRADSGDVTGYRLYYGKAPGAYESVIDVGDITVFTFTDLTPGQYYFAVTSYDAYGKESEFSEEVSTTIEFIMSDGGVPRNQERVSYEAGPPNAKGATMFSVQTNIITMDAAMISWKTGGADHVQIEYGTTTAYGRTTLLLTTIAARHSQSLSGLVPDTLYHYRIKARDATGDVRTSPDFTFTTLPPGPTKGTRENADGR